jgi:gamma-glutamyl phosphate reductase
MSISINAKRASQSLSIATEIERNQLLTSIHDHLLSARDTILAANQLDLEAIIPFT